MGRVNIHGQSGGGINDTLPAMPTDFAVVMGNESATLTFTVPTAYYGGAIIVQKVGSIPSGVNDGIKIEASSGSVILTVLTNDVQYYWRLYPYNDKKQYQTVMTGAVVGGIPRGLPDYTYTGSHTRYDSVHPVNGTPRYYVVLKSSGNFILLNDAAIDVFLVGGGSGGVMSASQGVAGGGGGGGYTKTVSQFAMVANVAAACVIGAGGNGGYSVAGNNVGSNSAGGATSFGVQSVAGGQSGVTGNMGANGGSGGAGGQISTQASPSGGSNGNDGSPGYLNYFGVGQHTTTRPFNAAPAPFNTMYYAGGGGSGSAGSNSPGVGGNGGGANGAKTGSQPTAAAANTGGGGGGTYGYNVVISAGTGGSGLIIVRVGDWSA